ncbi:hypothetical protein [Streptomyces kronopolitis]|uniref:hypothetical protein n=1 Tax=Streptomyces kronopolitis TaxID=1612435 RepID=UPI0036A8DB8C
MNDVLLPSFVGQLLEHGRDPGEVPEIPARAATGWLVPLAVRVLSVLGPHVQERAFLAHGYAHLPLPSGDDRATYLRIATHCAMTPWSLPTTAVVLTITGTTSLKMYQDPADQTADRPQYLREFGPEQVFAIHPGTLGATQSSPAGLHVLASRRCAAGRGSPITSHARAATVRRARRKLEDLVHMSSTGGQQ